MKNKTGSVGKFSDPATKPWIWAVFALLFAALIPVWPISGHWWGVPAWAVFAVAISALTSAFTAFVILRVWKDSKEAGSGRDHDQH